MALARVFENLGARFVSGPGEIAARLEALRALVFDWDGVFGGKEPFSEADAMGVNMLRFGLWRRDNCLPVTAVVSGQGNDAALRFARREHFHAIYQNVLDKRSALRHLCDQHGLQPRQVGVVFDDINDLGMAREAGVRFLVRSPGAPLLLDHAVDEGLCDYITANAGSSQAVREVSELVLGLIGRYGEVVRSRSAADASYRGYLEARDGCELVTVR